MHPEQDPARTRVSMSGTLSVADKESGDYLYLPFEMPPDTRRIDVTYDYNRSTFAQSKRGDESVLDIGIFAPGSDPPSPDSFRGWSGGARSGFFVADDDATPGYTPGPLEPGTWYVVLGLYRIAASGCDYTVNIEFSANAGDPRHDAQHGDSQAHIRTPRPTGSDSGLEPDSERERWYVGDLQSHTHHSDAKATVSQLAMVARDRGLDFLAVTDHNTISHHADLAGESSETLLLVPGMEITTYYGHTNVWGLHEWIDFRYRTKTEVAPAVEKAHGQGALISINHPHTDCPWEYGWIDGFDCIEVWQGLWNKANLAAVAWWDTLLAAGVRVVGVGGSDRHEPAHYDPFFPHQVGTPTTRVRAACLETADILAGIRAGRVTLAADPGGPWIDLTVTSAGGDAATVGDTVLVTPSDSVTVAWSVSGARGDVLELVSGGEVIHRSRIDHGAEQGEYVYVPGGRGYVRAHVVAAVGSDPDPDGCYYPRCRSLTNPIFFGAQ